MDISQTGLKFIAAMFLLKFTSCMSIFNESIGKEIGFYKGFVSTWKLLAVDGTLKKRQLRIIDQLSLLLNSVDYNNPEDEQMETKLGEIRTKFKQLSSMLRLPVDVKKDSDSAMSF